jgi:hypothetical protein
MRLHRALPFLLAVALACRPPHGPTPPAPTVATFQGPDSGILVRTRSHGAKPVIGRLLAPLDSGAPWVILCRDSTQGCRASSSLRPDTVPIRTLEHLDVRTSASGKGAYLGLYLGGLAGALIRSPDRAQDVGPMFVGFFAGGGFGGLVGSLFHTWTPAIPCYPHDCYRGSRRQADASYR